MGPDHELREREPVPPADAGSGAEPVAANVELAGLSANTTYHYRLVAVNEFGTTFGEDETFTTSGPPRITREPATGIGHETATIKAKIDPDELATEYHFEYGETTTYGIEVPVGGASIGSGSEPVAVSATLSGLKLGVTYHFRVVATNGAGTTTRRRSDVHDDRARGDRQRVGQSREPVSATLQTQVNPLGHDTTYYFQYGTESCKANPAACTTMPTPPGTDIGAGEADQPGSIEAQELRPGTTYHYRVVAHNSLGTSEGIEHTFMTQQSSNVFALPDGRAWEMVTPPDKHGAPVEALTREGGLILASEDGNALTYVARWRDHRRSGRQPQPGNAAGPRNRSAEGWSSQDIATPNAKGEGVTPGNSPEYQFFTPDLSFALVEPGRQRARGTATGAGSDADDDLPARQRDRDLCAAGHRSERCRGTEFGHQIHFVSATADFSHVVLQSKVALTGGSSGRGPVRVERRQASARKRLPGGAPAPEPELGYYHVHANAISSDGSRIIWTTSEANHRGHLYMRDTGTGETIQLDAAHGVPEPSGGHRAVSDGHKRRFASVLHRSAALDRQLDGRTVAGKEGRPIRVRNGRRKRQTDVRPR